MSELVKYPRTPHLPSSPGYTSDDVKLMADPLIGLEVVVTEKMDGENTTMYGDAIHARSLDSKYHPSRTWVNNFHAQIAHDIPAGYRIVGENLYAAHSLKYDNLKSYFYGISIWAEDTCLDWDTTLEWFDLLGITPVPVLARGIWPMDIVIDESTQEGFVVRNVEAFNAASFSENVAKYVRSGHVQTGDHWMHGEITINDLEV